MKNLIKIYRKEINEKDEDLKLTDSVSVDEAQIEEDQVANSFETDRNRNQRSVDSHEHDEKLYKNSDRS